MIRLEKVTKSYNIDEETVFYALKESSVEIKKKEFVSIIGPSGSGKSTLMHLIGLLDKPTSGEIIIQDKKISHLNDDQISSLRNEFIGFVFQQFNLIPKLTVLENILLPSFSFQGFVKTLFKFFPIGSVILLISLPYFWFKDRKFIIFPLFIFLSFIFLSIINPFGNLQPRYLSYFMFVYYFSVFYFLYKLFKKNIFILIITFFLVSDVYQFPKMINLTYGNKLPKTAVVSLSWIEFPDIKSQVEYVNNNYKKGDVIISLQPKGQTEVYLKPKLDYILRTKNYINEGHMEKDIFVDDYSKIPIITTVGELERIISLSDRIWLISSSSETLEVEHIDKATYNLLLKLANKVVYRGKEVNSKIYLINEKK